MRQYFNPRSPHGERPAHQSEDDDKPHISIHAPAWGATSPAFTSAPASTYFNPRSRMGSDRLLTIVKIFIGISIHAPPHGERQATQANTTYNNSFQSTPPAWGATTLKSRIRGNHTISIHAPRMGSDCQSGHVP